MYPTRITGRNYRIDIYDLVPSNAKSATPVIVVPGWCGTPEMYRKNIATLAEFGRRTLVVDAPDGIDFSVPLDVVGRGVSPAQIRRSGALLMSLDEKEIEETDGIG